MVSDLSDWESCSPKDELVPISTSTLSLAVRGPARKNGQPVVICESGAGMRGICWAPVARLIAPHARIYYYDRAGLGASTPSTLPRTAANMARELQELLQTTGIRPPYITVGHSLAGIITREFLALSDPGEIAGMVFVDANQEKTQEKLQFPFDAFDALDAVVPVVEATGFNQVHKLTPKEYSQVMHSSEGPTSKLEMDKWESNLIALGTKKQFESQSLSEHPVSVIMGSVSKDWNAMLDGARGKEGVAAQHLAAVEACLERFELYGEELHREQLLLSAREDKRRFVKVDCGHVIHMIEPAVVAAEVMRMLQDYGQ